ncbi:MAG: hypothetical protein WD042_10465 [Phycisphaeraceae bacterium]
MELRQRAKGVSLPGLLSELQGESLRIAIDRPDFWEIRLFSEVLQQEVARHRHLKQDLYYGVAFSGGERFEGPAVMEWVLKKNGQVLKLVEGVTALVNTAYEDAMGPPGTPGDAEKLVYTAKRLGDAYKAAIEWAAEFHRVQVDSPFVSLLKAQSRLTENIILAMETVSAEFAQQVEGLVANPPADGEERSIEVCLNLEILPGIAEVAKELADLRRKFHQG